MSAPDRRRGSVDAEPDRGDAAASDESSAIGEPAADGDPSADRDPPEVDVRGEEPAARCPYCGQPFRAERLETLHRGLEHPDVLSDRERAAFERAYRAEAAAVRRFRLRALGGVVLCYFGFLLAYAVVA